MSDGSELLSNPLDLLTPKLIDNSFLGEIAKLRADVNQLLLQSKRSVTASALTVDGHLGLMTAGEFRTGNGVEPGEGFTGTRTVYPAVTYGANDYHLAGVNNDALQWGANSETGVLEAGAGAVTLDADGVTIAEGTGSANEIAWEDAAANAIYIISASGDRSTPTDVTASHGMNVDSSTVGEWRASVGNGGLPPTRQSILSLYLDSTDAYLALHEQGTTNLLGFKIGNNTAPAQSLDVAGSATLTGFVEIAEQATPATPASGYGRIYFKTDGKPYALNDAGTETDLTAPIYPPTTLTIASGVVTVSRGFHHIDTEAAAATDDLDTINGGADGQVLIVGSVDSGRDVVLKHVTGNLNLGGAADITLGNVRHKVTLIYDGLTSQWHEIARNA